MATRVRSSVRTLGLESLEDRALKAGDVTVALVGDDLVIIGDNAANEVRIRQSLGRLVVEGLNGTQINGRDRAFKALVGDDVRVDLNGGLDKLTVDHETPLLFQTDIKGDLDVDEVEDVKLFNLDLHGSLDVDLESVNGRVRIFDFVIEGLTSIHGTGGEQDAEISAGIFDHNLTLNFSGSGDDSVILGGVTADTNVNITTGSGRDDVRTDFFTRIGLDLNIDTDSNDDFVQVQSTIITDDLFIDVGNGDNEVVINSVIVDDIVINLDDGDDDVLTLAVKQADQVTIDVDNNDILDIDAAGINHLNVIND